MKENLNPALTGLWPSPLACLSAKQALPLMGERGEGPLNKAVR